MLPSFLDTHSSLATKWRPFVDVLGRISGFDATLVMYADQARGEIEVVVADDSAANPWRPRETAMLNTGLYCEAVMASDRPLHVPDAYADPVWDHNPDLAVGMLCYFGLPIRWPDGRPFGTICVLDRTPKTPSGQTNEVMTMVRDAIEDDLRRAVREELTTAEEVFLRREAEDRYAAVFHSAAVGIARIALDGRWLQVNERLCEITGYSADELVTMTFQDITHPDDLQADLDQLAQLVAGEIPTYSMDKRYFRRDGRLIWIRLTVALVRDEHGTPSYIVSVIEDITEYKALQRAMEQSQKLEAMGRLVGGISHEFNNQLSAIGANLFLARNRPDEAESYIEKAEHHCAEATEMVRSLLAYSRNTPSEKEAMPLGPLLRRILDELRVVVPATVNLSADLPTDDELPISGNATQLHQVVLNLVNNAVYAVRNADEPTIRVTARRRPTSVDDHSVRPTIHADELVEITVDDNGIGIRKDEADTIFEPFFTTKPPGEGTGLGLAMVASLIEQHGGTVEVDVDRPVGTRFRILLPVLPVDTAAPVGPTADTIDPGAGETVLLVDDNLNVLEAMQEVIETLGYHVITAHDGLEGLDRFLTTAGIGCVVTDHLMPRMDGIELAERLRAADPNARVLLMTGREPDLDLGELTIPVLPKPISIAALSDALRQLLATK